MLYYAAIQPIATKSGWMTRRPILNAINTRFLNFKSVNGHCVDMAIFISFLNDARALSYI